VGRSTGFQKVVHVIGSAERNEGRWIDRKLHRSEIFFLSEKFGWFGLFVKYEMQGRCDKPDPV
jgi:hypothetical protein